jgi:hypothetical protein
MAIFFNVITCPFSKTIFLQQTGFKSLFNNENRAILGQGQGEEIGHTCCIQLVDICLLIQNLKKSCRSVNLCRSYRHFSLSKITRFSIITPVKKGLGR